MLYCSICDAWNVFDLVYIARSKEEVIRRLPDAIECQVCATRWRIEDKPVTYPIMPLGSTLGHQSLHDGPSPGYPPFTKAGL